MKLNNDIEPPQIKKIFSILREETPIFQGMSNEEITGVQNEFKILQFKR